MSIIERDMVSTETDDVIVNGVVVYEGHYVKILHSEGRRDGFVGKFRYARYDESGEVTAVDVWGGRKKGHESYRTVSAHRVVMLSTRVQNRLQRDDEARREQGLAPKWKAYSDV
jgi:hypothetical protein